MKELQRNNQSDSLYESFTVIITNQHEKIVKKFNQPFSTFQHRCEQRTILKF